jgi:hypothetical protein
MSGSQKALTAVAQEMQRTVTAMHTDFWGSVGADKLPPIVGFYVDQYANQGYNGAKSIRDALEKEFDNAYFQDQLGTFFGVGSWNIAVYGDVTGSDKHYMWATGFKYRYQGYNIEYSFSTGPAYSYHDTDCRSGDAHTMATCLRNMHGAGVWVLHTGTFFASHQQGCYVKSFDTSKLSDIRIVTPGRSASESDTASISIDSDGSAVMVSDRSSDAVREVARKKGIEIEKAMSSTMVDLSLPASAIELL